MNNKKVFLKSINFNLMPEGLVRDKFVELVKEELEEKAKNLFIKFIQDQAVKALSNSGFEVRWAQLTVNPESGAYRFVFCGDIISLYAKGIANNPSEYGWRTNEDVVFSVLSSDAESRTKISVFFEGTESHGFDHETEELDAWIKGFCEEVCVLADSLELLLTNRFAESFAKFINPSFTEEISYRKVIL